jgi:hypothetical protein
MAGLVDQWKIIKYKLLFGGTRGLRSYEQMCLDAYLGAVPAEVARVVRQQVELCDIVHRNSKDKLVVLKFLTKDSETEIPAFPNKEEELRVARVTLKSGRERLSGDLIFEDGILMGFKFTKSPHILQAKLLEVASVKIFVDVTAPATVRFVENVSERSLLFRLMRHVPLHDIEEPTSTDSRAAFLDEAGVRIPTELTQLLSETNGFFFPEGRFDGTRARVLPWPEENILVLAEDRQCTFGLCLREHGSDGEFYILDQVNAELFKVGTDVVAAFVELRRRITQAEGE